MTIGITESDVIMERRRVLLLLAFSPVIVGKENGDKVKKVK